MTKQWMKAVTYFVTTMIFLGIILSYCRTYDTIRSDGDGYYVQLRSFIIDGDLDYANEYRDYELSIPRGYVEGYKTETGHVPNKYFFGPAILWLPFFLLAHLLTLFANMVGFSVEPNGYTIFYHLSMGFGSAIYALLGLRYIFKFLRHYFSEIPSFIATLCVLLGTNLIYYTTTEPTMSHAMSMFAVSLFVYTALINQETKYFWVKLGLFAGLMLLVRPQNILFAAAALPAVVQLIKNKGFKSVIPIGIATFAFFVMLLPQFIVWKVVFGQFIKDSYAGESFNFGHPELYKVLFSPKHGLICWTPIVGIALVGVLASWRKRTIVGVVLFACFFMQYYLNASWHSWWFAMSYGNRGFINCSIVVAFGLAFILETWPKLKTLFLAIFGFFIVHNLLFYLEYSMFMHGADDPVTFVESFQYHGKVLLLFVERFMELFA